MNVLNPNVDVGRDSVRITSKQAWGTGSLVVVDLAHVPGGQCGSWPAMWMLGPNWPYNGEIDIIEGLSSLPKYLIERNVDLAEQGLTVINTTAWPSTRESPPVTRIKDQINKTLDHQAASSTPAPTNSAPNKPPTATPP